MAFNYASRIQKVNEYFWCRRCEKPCASVEVYTDLSNDCEVFTYTCHGASGLLSISHQELQRLKVRGSLPLELRERLWVFTPNDLGWPPTVDVLGTSYSLSDYHLYLKRSRDMLLGLRVEKIILGEPFFRGVQRLLALHRERRGVGMMGFTFTTYLSEDSFSWQNMAVCLPDPALLTRPYTFDLSVTPFRYCNQGGSLMYLLPPWADTVTTTTPQHMAARQEKERGRRMLLLPDRTEEEPDIKGG